MGGSDRPLLPEPIMTGATSRCSRSTARAAMNEETVHAPPSIRMRFSPRANKASTMACGDRCSAVRGTTMVSTPAGHGAGSVRTT